MSYNTMVREAFGHVLPDNDSLIWSIVESADRCITELQAQVAALRGEVAELNARLDPSMIAARVRFLRCLQARADAQRAVLARFLDCLARRAQALRAEEEAQRLRVLAEALERRRGELLAELDSINARLQPAPEAAPPAPPPAAPPEPQPRPWPRLIQEHSFSLQFRVMAALLRGEKLPYILQHQWTDKFTRGLPKSMPGEIKRYLCAGCKDLTDHFGLQASASYLRRRPHELRHLFIVYYNFCRPDGGYEHSPPGKPDRPTPAQRLQLAQKKWTSHDLIVMAGWAAGPEPIHWAQRIAATRRQRE